MKTPSSVCHFCKGSKKITNPFTFKLVQCPVCHGSGHRRTEGVTVPARPDNEQARAEDAWADRELAEELSQDDPDTLKTLSIKEQQTICLALNKLFWKTPEMGDSLKDKADYWIGEMHDIGCDRIKWDERDCVFYVKAPTPKKP